MRASIAEDLGFGPIIDALQNPDEPNGISPSFLRHFTLEEDMLFYDGSRLCIPKGPLQTKLLEEEHDADIAGHQGVEKTYERMHRHYYWPRLSKDVH